MNERWLEDRDDDISKLFRDNEEQLEETPSFRTWDRVERKLERRRGQKRKIMYRYTSMVAASIGILAMIYFIGFLDNFPTFDGLAQKSEAESPENTNTEKQNTSDKEVAILEKQAEYKTTDKDDFAKLEEEKSFKQKKDTEPIASYFTKKPSKINSQSPVNSPRVAKTNDAKTSINGQADTVQVDTKRLKKVETPSSNWFFPVEEEIAAEEIEEEEEVLAFENFSDKAIKVDANIYRPSKLEESSLNSQGNPVIKRKKEAASRKDKSSASTRDDTEKQKYSINQFNWMSGDWRDISIGGSYESWTVGENGLNGSGYVVINGDTSFVEQMRIYQRGKDIFFEGPVDASQKIRKFRLDSYEGNEATFNRKGKNFPNQVVITRHTNNSYSIIYQNKDAITVDTTEQLYFKYRNRLNSQRAARNMTRY